MTEKKGATENFFFFIFAKIKFIKIPKIANLPPKSKKTGEKKKELQPPDWPQLAYGHPLDRKKTFLLWTILYITAT